MDKVKNIEKPEISEKSDESEKDKDEDSTGVEVSDEDSEDIE